jgi:hypothetical protein
MVDDSTLRVGGSTSTVHGCTLMVSISTSTVGDGTLRVGSGTSMVDGCTMTVGGGTSAVDSQRLHLDSWRRHPHRHDSASTLRHGQVASVVPSPT